MTAEHSALAAVVKYLVPKREGWRVDGDVHIASDVDGYRVRFMAWKEKSPHVVRYAYCTIPHEDLAQLRYRNDKGAFVDEVSARCRALTASLFPNYPPFRIGTKPSSRRLKPAAK